MQLIKYNTARHGCLIVTQARKTSPVFQPAFCYQTSMNVSRQSASQFLHDARKAGVRVHRIKLP